jgi:sugar phosphate isomerase/epimerase
MATVAILDPDCEVVDALGFLGITSVIIPWLPETEFADDKSVIRTAERINKVAERMRRAGLRVGYHNHWWELWPLQDGFPALARLTDYLDPAVFTELDTYWAHVGGADVPALLEQISDRVNFMHIKDGPGAADQPHTALGEGVTPLAAVLDAAPSRALQIVELDDCATDMMTALTTSAS